MSGLQLLFEKEQLCIASQLQRRERLGVAVAHLLLAQRSVDPAGDGVAEPDHRSEEQKCKGQLKCINHESGSVIFFYMQSIKRAINCG